MTGTEARLTERAPARSTLSSYSSRRSGAGSRTLGARKTSCATLLCTVADLSAKRSAVSQCVSIIYFHVRVGFARTTRWTSICARKLHGCPHRSYLGNSAMCRASAAEAALVILTRHPVIISRNVTIAAMIPFSAYRSTADLLLLPPKDNLC